jgi:hypothetical protein
MAQPVLYRDRSSSGIASASQAFSAALHEAKTSTTAFSFDVVALSPRMAATYFR